MYGNCGWHIGGDGVLCSGTVGGETRKSNVSSFGDSDGSGPIKLSIVNARFGRWTVWVGAGSGVTLIRSGDGDDIGTV